MACGGVVVRPGDIVVAEANGVVAVPTRRRNGCCGRWRTWKAMHVKIQPVLGRGEVTNIAAITEGLREQASRSTGAVARARSIEVRLRGLRTNVGVSVPIHDPYAVPGDYRKVQLHCHTTESDGRFRPRELLRMYKEAGYSFVFITDHNRVTCCEDLNDGTFLALPGTEDTVSYLLPPLGPHLARLFVDQPSRRGSAQDRINRTIAEGRLASLCHPSWTGNLWTGTWSPQAVTELRGYNFLEIVNPHSDIVKDLARWDAALRQHGPDSPVWAVAVDDCHRRDQFNRAWVMARVANLSARALRASLAAGAFYPSTGPEGRFWADGGVISAEFKEVLEARILDSTGRARATERSTTLSYSVQGNEGYLRVEGVSPRGRIWSQPFWVLSAPH